MPFSAATLIGVAILSRAKAVDLRKLLREPTRLVDVGNLTLYHDIC
jgi:hypothetical protein